MSCSKDTQDEGDITYECKNLFYVDDSSRSTSRTLKGHILFSWKNNVNGWNYSIVPNLNIRAAHDNVCAGNSFTGEECLKNNFSHFAVGEEFFWAHDFFIETVEGKKIYLSYPPDQIIRDIQVFCDSIEIELVLE
jgi:hypothetical protein